MSDRRARLERHDVARGDVGYPVALADLEDAPSQLHVLGDVAVLGERCVSVIGARRATPYGLAAARLAGRVAAECGLVVVTGGAMGCDHAACRAALDAGGRTIIVAGTGADVTYPQSSRDIFLQAPDQGAVVSLEPWGQAPRRYAFPKRNRVIAALSQSLIICEAGLRSGTFSTAVAADDLGRDLYVVPGSIFSPESMGANRLIADGACVIASEMDLEQRIALDYGVLRMVREDARRPEGRLLAALVSEPTRPDDLARYLQQSIVQVLGALADYESRGVVRRLFDGRFSLTETAYLAHGTMGASDDGGPANAGGEKGR